MAATGPAAGQTIEWRRLAADKNVSLPVATQLWEQAKAAAADPMARSDLFRKLIDEAAKNPTATPEPGKETLVDKKGPNDPASLGPGKTTQVLLNQDQKPGVAKPPDAGKDPAAAPATAPAPPAAKDAEVAKDAAAAAPGADPKKKDEEPTAKPTVDKVRNDLVGAAQAAGDVAALLADADPATIMEALRQLRSGDPNLLHKILTVAGSAIERRLGTTLPDPTQTKTGGPLGISVPIVTLEGVDTHTVRDDGAPMINAVTVADKVSEWRAEIQKRTPAEQDSVTPNLARATALNQTVGDQAKKTKLGDEPTKLALPDTQRQLGTVLGTVVRAVQTPAPPPEQLKQPATPAAADAPKDAASPQGAPSTNAEAKGPGEKVPGTPDKQQPANVQAKGPGDPSAADKQASEPAPKKDPVEQALEDFIKDELARLKPKPYSSATKATVLGLVNSLESFEFGLQTYIGKYASHPKVAEAKAFLSDSRTALEDQAEKLFGLTVLTRTAAPKLDPGCYKELDALKAEITPWLTAFKNDPAFFRGVSTCDGMIREVDAALAVILTHRDKLLRAAKTAIDGVDVNQPGTVIADEIAKVQIWLDAILMRDPSSMRAAVVDAKQLKEEAIKKGADAKAAEAQKADTQPNEPAKQDAPQAQPQAQQKPPAPPTQPAPEPAKELTPQERAELERKKEELELHKVEEQLELMMENALKGWEVFNVGGSGALTAAVLLAHIAPQISIPLVIGKAGIMFFTKYSKKKGYKQAKNQLLMLGPEQIRELSDLFAADLLSFKQALEQVDKAAKVAKFQHGAGEATLKKEAVPLAGDTVEVVTAAADAIGLQDHILHLAHVGASIAAPIIAGIQLGLNFREAATAREKIRQINAKLAEIDRVLGRPVVAEAPPPPPLPAEALVLPPLPPPPQGLAPPTAAKKPDEELTPTPADPITVPTSMNNAPHTLVAKPDEGKIEFNSITGYAAEKLKSILNLVPEDKREKLQTAIASAVEAAAVVIDPALKPGAKPNDRPAVVKRLGAALHDLAGAIRTFGDATKYTDADPNTVKRIDAEQKKEKEAMAAAGVPVPAGAGASPTAAPTAPTAAAPTAAPDASAAKPDAAKADAAPDAAAKPDAAKADAAPDAAAKPDAAKPDAPKADAAASSTAPGKDAAPTAALTAPANENAAPAAAKDGAAPAAPAGKDAAPAGKDPGAPTPPPPDAAATAPKAEKPPVTEDAYVAYVQTEFQGELATLNTLFDAGAAKATEAQRAAEKLGSVAAEIQKLEDQFAETKKGLDEKALAEKQEEHDAAVKLMGLAKPYEGKTMEQLLKEAEQIVLSIKVLGKPLKAQKDALEGVMQASMMLGKQIDPESAEEGRQLYITIDTVRNPALVKQGTASGMADKEIATMAVSHRTWLRQYWRTRVMRNKTHAGILFLRDLGITGQPDGVTVRQVMEKSIAKLKTIDPKTQKALLGPDCTPETASESELKLIYAAMVKSAGKTNPGVNATSGAKVPAPTAAAGPSAAPAGPTAAPDGKGDAPATTPSVTAAPAPSAEAPAKADAPAASNAAAAPPAAKADAPAAPSAPAADASPKGDAPKADAAPAAKTDAPAAPSAPAADKGDAPSAPAADASPKGDASKADAAPTAAAPSAPTSTASAAPTPAAPTPAAPTAPAPADVKPADVKLGDAKPEDAKPKHTAEQSKAEIASVTSAPIEQGKDAPPAHFTPGAPLDLKTDSPDPIRLKDKVITATKEYLALDQKPETTQAERDVKLTEIKVLFAQLREAMKAARGELDNLVLARVKFEKYIGALATSGVWPQGIKCVDKMAVEAKHMILETKNGATVPAAQLDAQLKTLPDAVKEEVGKQLGTSINVGFAGAVGLAFDTLVDTLTSGSLVQKAQTLMNFAQYFMTGEVIKGTGKAFERAATNLTLYSANDPDFQLAKLLEDAKGKKPGLQYKILCSSPAFMAKMKAVKAQNAENDKNREKEGELKNKGASDDVRSSERTDLKGDMDTKTPQQPVDVLTETQLDFVSQQGEPKVDLTQFNEVQPDEVRRQTKVDFLKSKGIRLSLAPGLSKNGEVHQPFVDEKLQDNTAGMVDATSIDENAVAATVNEITVENRQFIEGKAENIVDPKAKWIKDAVAAKAPLKAGISGTTARFIGAARLLGGDTDGAVIAMIGHLQAIEAHSFWEIVNAAGLKIEAGKYLPFTPNEGGMVKAGVDFVDQETNIDLGPGDKTEKRKKLLGI